MERLLAPERFDVEPDSPLAALEWDHWYRRFLNFSQGKSDSDKLKLLFNYISSKVFQHVSAAGTFNDAVAVLKSLYVKPANEIYSRHKLATRCQQPEETVDQYLQALNLLAKDCNFKAVTAEKHREDFVRDAFIRGLSAPHVRQRLLENPILTLSDAYEKARSLELAQLQAQSYNQTLTLNALSAPDRPPITPAIETQDYRSSYKVEETLAAAMGRCFYCGYDPHVRGKCPARNATCNLCGRKGHFAKVCRSGKRNPKQTASMVIATNYGTKISSLDKAMTLVRVNGIDLHALLDTGSSCSFISDRSVRELRLPVFPSQEEVSMASTSLRSKTAGQCMVNLQIRAHVHENVRLCVLPDLCADIIIGQDIMKKHSSIEVEFGGPKTPLSICGLAVANIAPAALFDNLTPECKPIAVKSRRHTDSDAKFIEAEIDRLLFEDVIEVSKSPWRAQVLVTVSENHKKRMVIDYSRTINRFTQLDAYPLPRIEEIVNRVARYEVFSTIDMRSAYHQFPIKEEDKPYTAFEACGQLFQFKRIPFGVTNGVAAFQRGIDGIIRAEKLTDTYAYIDDVTVCGKNQEEHDKNLKRFTEAVRKYNLTLNNEKSAFSLRTISLLGYVISNKTIRPDPDRLRPLRELQPPDTSASLKRAIGMFAHFSSCIPQFSQKIASLTRTTLPLKGEALKVFQDLKQDIENAALAPVDNEAMFIVETDASDNAIGATLSQLGRPVAFFSRTLTGSECKHASVEKEAYAIVEATRKWRHFLMGRHFRLITDQRSVAFMFDLKVSSKIKNEKILRWRLELSCFSYDIIYRPGTENLAADAFSRICSTVSSNNARLMGLHDTLCHPGITRMYHWIRSKNLAYSVEDVKKTILACPVCAEVKPRFFKHGGKLIKATSAFERLNMDFKGPLPSFSQNRYILTIVDEYSRYPFAIACQDMTSATVIAALKNIFSLFGTPSYIHTDRGASFMSQELKSFLNVNGIATSRTTPYNPRGNGQVERYNGVIWRTVGLALKSKGKSIKQWECVLAQALHAIRSLLCTATNETPHERMFRHPRRSSNGQSAPSWLLQPGAVYLRCPVRSSKFDPLVREVTLLDGNAEYAHVKLPDGRESTVSTRQLAPKPRDSNEEVDKAEEIQADVPIVHDYADPQTQEVEPLSSNYEASQIDDNSPGMSEPNRQPSVRLDSPVLRRSLGHRDGSNNLTTIQSDSPVLRRSLRHRKPPSHLQDFVAR